MPAYYNEVNAEAAEWLRQLIKVGEIAPGVVDERSIEDVTPDDLKGYTQCHFFAGIGVWSRALRLAGWPDDRAVWTGSCPCQPFSAAGKGAGFADERHLWPAFFHLISVCRPERVFGEQVATAIGLTWLDLVSTDLEAMGYAVGAVPFTAAGAGAPHIRERLYWVAVDELQQRPLTTSSHYEASRWDQKPAAPPGFCCDLHADQAVGFWSNCESLRGTDRLWRPVEPGALPVVNGSPASLGCVRNPGLADFAGADSEARRMRLVGYGNAIVCPQAVAFISATL